MEFQPGGSICLRSRQMFFLDCLRGGACRVPFHRAAMWRIPFES
jgi:hypothetical protein